MNAQLFEAELLDLGNSRFQLLSYKARMGEMPQVVASFDVSSGLLNMPVVKAFASNWSVSLQQGADGILRC